MPLFSHRRLYSMLDQLSGHLDYHQSKNLQRRLENEDTNTALAAEAELCILWGVSRVAQMVAEPVLPNSTQRPDISSNNLFKSTPAIIEVRAISDDNFSGKEAMDRTANIISGYADELRKGAGKHLYFEYNERSYWTNRFNRERCVDPSFTLTSQIKDQLKQWITSSDWPNPQTIRILSGKTDVFITWNKTTHALFRTHCRMPAVAYDLEDNPIYKALKKKARQVKGAHDGNLRCVILVDAGCNLLRRLRPLSPVFEVGGQDIIHHALAKLSLDAVIVLSPYRENNFMFGGRSALIWNVSCFDCRKEIPEGEYDRIKEMASQLPRPRLEGYQARSLHKQGSFGPNKNWYVPTTVISGSEGKMTIKLSASLLHEYLAGRIDSEQFRQKAFSKDKNFFDLELLRGNSIQNIKFESGGVDEDDDYIIFDLDFDWGKASKKQV